MNREKGITLIALIVTIIVLLIIASITIVGSIRGIDESQENKLLSELKMVQHAVVERKTKYDLTKDTTLLKGEVTNINKINVEGVELTLKLTQSDIDTSEKAYRRLGKTQLSEIGLEVGAGSYEDTYIVNYSTGEVYNESIKTTPTGKLLYIANE